MTTSPNNLISNIKVYFFDKKKHIRMFRIQISKIKSLDLSLIISMEFHQKILSENLSRELNGEISSINVNLDSLCSNTNKFQFP